ncbi:nitroreductase family protein [Cohnella boryungensis]|uniref:Nitroreductase family protein n=1 Tax=Cohnella boryungensis TaxID=768479 RepID=A0ABV8SHI3_9BACL
MNSQSPASEPSYRLSQLISVIRNRRTIRSYADRPIPQELILRLLLASKASVSLDWNDSVARLIYFNSQQGKRKAAGLIMDAYKNQKLYKWLPKKLNQAMAERIARIPAFLAVIRKLGPSSQHNDRNYAAISAMIQSFSLLAWENDIGIVWNTDPALREPSVAAGLGLQEDERIVCLLYMGMYDKAPKPKARTAIAQKLTHLAP